MTNPITEVAFCVVKANCNGPSLLTHSKFSVGHNMDRWECKHCYGSALYPEGTSPQPSGGRDYGRA